MYMRKENMLPVNAFYITNLRDHRRYDRPLATWADKKTGEVLRQRNRIDALDMLIYIMLLSRADNNELICYPSIETICRDCDISDRRTIWEHLSMLEQMGFIEIRKKRGRPNTYFMKDFAVWMADPHY